MEVEGIFLAYLRGDVVGSGSVCKRKGAGGRKMEIDSKSRIKQRSS